MKITIYQPRLSYYIGGGEVIPANQAKELARLGHQVEILTTRAPFIQESPMFRRLKKTPGIRIDYIDVPPRMKWIYDTAPGQDWARWDNESLGIGLIARERLKDSASDLVATHLLFDSIACPQDIPSVLHLHGYPANFSYHHQLLVRLPDAFISVSRTIEHKWKKIIPADTLSEVIPNGIDAKIYKPERLRQRYDLLYIGRLLPVKGIDTIIDAAASLPGIKVAIAGTGPIQSELQQMVKHKKLDSRVTFLGYVPDKDLPGLYNSSKVVVLPSKDKEGVLTTLLEAASCGRPIITTSAGSMAEFIINMVNGVIIPPDSPEELGRAAKLLLGDPDLRDKMGANARQSIETDWLWDKRIRQLEKTYEIIAGSKDAS